MTKKLYISENVCYNIYKKLKRGKLICLTKKNLTKQRKSML